MKDVDQKTRITPLEVTCYYWSSVFIDAETGDFLNFDNEKSSLAKYLKPETQITIKSLKNMHGELCEKYFDPFFTKQNNTATKEEEDAYWHIVDVLINKLKTDLDPQKYEVVKVSPPDPNPFKFDPKNVSFRQT